MSYAGKWLFHSIGTINEEDEQVYLGAEEYLNSPMVYIDETDEYAVADEMRERAMMIKSCVALCEDGKMYMLMPIPEGVTEAEVKAAAESGEIKLYDGMLTQDPVAWEDRGGELWAALGMGGEDGFVRIDDGEFITIMTTRYKKLD